MEFLSTIQVHGETKLGYHFIGVQSSIWIRMDPRIREERVIWRNGKASRRIVVDQKQVIIIDIDIPPSTKTAPRIFEKEGICCAGIHGPCVILQQEIIALVGGQNDVRDDVRLREQEGAKTSDDLLIRGTPDMDVGEKR